MNNIDVSEKLNAGRIEYVDIMKGIGMILVIIGHTWMPLGSKYILNSFHMPLFFLISGYFFKPAKSFLAVLRKNTKKLLLPYFLTASAVVFFQCIKAWTVQESIMNTLVIWVKAVMYGLPGKLDVSNVEGVERIGAIWFFQALFWAQTELFFILKISNRYIRSGIVLALNVLVVLLAGQFWFPANIGTGLAACTFLYIGHEIKDKKILSREKKSWLPAALIVSAVCIFYAGMITRPFILAYLQYPMYGLDILGGVSGAYIVMVISRMIEKKCRSLKDILKTVGGGTTQILCVHLIDLDCFMFVVNRIPTGLLKLCFRLCLDVGGGLAIKQRNTIYFILKRTVARMHNRK